MYDVGNGSFVGLGALLGQIVKTKNRDVESISNKIEFDIVSINENEIAKLGWMLYSCLP